jgi:hypothetical protein
MAGKAGLKAGLIGIVVMVVLTLINRLMGISGALVYVMCGVSMLAYLAVGVLAGVLLAPPRTAGKAAGAGAIAGLLSGLVSGVIGIVIMAISISRGQGIPGLDAQQMELLAETGLDPTLLAIPGAVCSLGLGTGAAAIGGTIFGALRPD